MLLKLAALGTLGFVAYRYVQRTKVPPRPAVAGGPLSNKAALQKNPDEPPAPELYD